MAYKQVKAFNQKTAGTIKGMCLQNVRLGYGISAKYPDAITAWNKLPAIQQHRTKTVPAGVDVPLYYTFKKEGHINVRLANGKVWSDGVIYNTVNDYLKAHPLVSYLGWGESVNDVRVLKVVADPVVKYKIRVNPGTWNVRKSPDGALYFPRKYVRGGQTFTCPIEKGWAKIAPAQYIGPVSFRKI